MEKAMNAFWWGNGGAGRGIKWMSWERLCVPKADGGLGFKQLRSFNVAMLVKQAWRLVTNVNPLVTQLMRSRYFPHTDFLNANLGSNPSYVWRSLIASQEVVRCGCRRRIGDGKSTRIWHVPWLPCPVNGFLTTNVPLGLQDATVHSLLHEGGGGWDGDILNDICNERDRELIQRIPISNRRREDAWYWLLEEKGNFTVRSCYIELRGESSCVDHVFWNKLWCLQLPGKVLNLLWHACRKWLPTASALVAKNVNIQSVCSWCHSGVEDDLHVLFNCSYAQEVWQKAGLINFVTVESNDTVLQVLKRVFQLGHVKHILMVGMVCWNLWQRRNTWMWNHINLSTFGVYLRACSMLTEWVRVKEEQSTWLRSQNSAVRQWCKPGVGWIKINTDAACMVDTNQVGVGCVIRDEHGSFLRARTNKIQRRLQPREVEAISLNEALSWTKEWRKTKCIFECDAKLLVEAVHGVKGNTYFHLIVEDCIELLKHFDEVLVCFAHRSANMIAHKLARAACSMSGLTEWLLTAPDFILCNLEAEMI